MALTCFRGSVARLAGQHRHWLRLRRSALKEKDCQHHVGGHLEELALSILVRGLAEGIRGKVLGITDSWLVVVALISIVNAEPRQVLADQGKDEQDEHRQGGTIAVQETSHCAPVLRGPVEILSQASMAPGRHDPPQDQNDGR